MTDTTPTCPACHARLLTDAERAVRVCEACAARAGAVPPGPRARPVSPCARCSHDEILRATLHDRAGSDYVWIQPIAVAYGYDTRHTLWGEVKALAPTSAKPHGTLVAHVCRACGYTELYTTGFADIPVGPQYGTELVRAGTDGDGPFR
jgi:hypothetical protein